MDMADQLIVVQASSSEDESMPSLVVGGGDGGSTEAPEENAHQTEGTVAHAEKKDIHKYDREYMLKLYGHPSAKIRPSILSPEFDTVVENGEGGNGDTASHNKLWSPELWIQSIWNPEPRQNMSMSGSAHGWSGRRQGDHDGHGQSMNRKKQIDRLKTESEDGIVLSPQRRSFVAGCQVSSSSAAANANVAGSQTGVVGGGTSGNQAHRRSASPPRASGDDRQQQAAPNPNARSSFRSRGGSNVTSPPMPQQPSQVQNATAMPGSGGFGRGDRVENWRDRSGYSSMSFGRGNVGKESPASVMYGRSRAGGMNSWSGNRRSYGGGGGYQYGGDESLPEWVTEGPSDMFETMELRGFDEEERQEMKQQMNGGEGQKRGGAGRLQQYRSSTESYSEKDPTRRPIEREQMQNLMQDNKSFGQQSSRKSAGDGEKAIGKVPAEVLVDGFDIGDMAHFLSVAGADFDSIANGDMSAQDKTSIIGGVPVPATPTAASRFSKFFARSGENAGSGRPLAESDKSKQTPVQKNQPKQQQSVSVMELLSKAAMAGDARQVPGTASSAALPAGAKSLDEIEAAYKPKNIAKTDAEGSPNKTLQELFQSARMVSVSHGTADTASQRKGDERMANADSQPKSEHLLDHRQQILESLQKVPPNATTNGAPSSTKGNPLSDPAQQQHLLDALRKLHVQQQQVQLPPQQHGDSVHRPPNPAGTNEAMNPFLAAYPQLTGFQHLLQQQQQAMQMGNLQTAANAGRIPSPLGAIPGVPVIHQQATGSSIVPPQPINPAFVGLLPPANVPPPPITQQDLLLAHTQSIYQRALMARKFQGIEEQQPPPKPSVLPQSIAGGGKLPTAFLPTSVIKQMHGGLKPTKEGSEEPNAAASSRPIVKQQQAFHGQAQEQVSPNSVNEQLLRNLQQQNANKAIPPSMSGSTAMGTQQPMAPPPSLTPQDLQRLIDQTHLHQRQRQHQERVLLEQYAKAQQQQQVGPNAAAPNAAINPAAAAALALQNNPMFVQMLRAQAMQAQAQQMALLQQQAAAGISQAPPQPIPASAAVSAIPNAAQLVRARMAASPAVPAAAASNPELMRQVFHQQQQQMMLNQLRQQGPAEANIMLNRLLTGQAAQQQQMHQMPGVAPPLGGHNYPPQGMVDTKPMTLEELERLHKQTAAMQQPQS